METLVKCQKFEVIRRDCPTNDGGVRPKEFVVHPGAVVILPLLSQERCILIRQMRHSIGQALHELPAGTLDMPGESPEKAAGRELQEETGYSAGRLEKLCEFYPSPGISTELIRAYVATDLRKTEQRLEATEQIEVEVVAIDEALRMIRDGRIVDAKTIVTLLRWTMDERGRA